MTGSFITLHLPPFPSATMCCCRQTVTIRVYPDVLRHCCILLAIKSQTQWFHRRMSPLETEKAHQAACLKKKLRDISIPLLQPGSARCFCKAHSTIDTDAPSLSLFNCAKKPDMRLLPWSQHCNDKSLPACMQCTIFLPPQYKIALFCLVSIIKKFWTEITTALLRNIQSPPRWKERVIVPWGRWLKVWWQCNVPFDHYVKQTKSTTENASIPSAEEDTKSVAKHLHNIFNWQMPRCCVGTRTKKKKS